MDDTGTRPPSRTQYSEKSSVPENLAEILTRERRRFEILDTRYASHAERLNLLEKRLMQGRFHLAVLGQVKRGKSTLLNALLGEDILPSSVVPLTALPTFIQYGEQRLLRVRYHDSRPDTVLAGEPTQGLNKHLMAYVTEDANPENRKGVREVEITLPVAILRDVVLIDTPGIGSTYRHNTQATMNFLPQCDAALFVISADPPITEVEVRFLKEIQSRIGQLFFVLNKVDYLTEAEREMALEFYRTVLTRDTGMDPGTRIFLTSARKGLQAQEAGDSEKWEESGLAEVSAHLIDFLAKEKNRVLKDAIGRKARDLFHEVHLQIELERRALELPLDELESRLALFDQKIAEAQEQRMHAQDLLAGDLKRVYAELETYIEHLRAPLHDQLIAVAEPAIAASSPQDPLRAAEQAVAEAIPLWFERELGRITTMMDERVATRLKEHEDQANDLIESIRKAAAELFDIPYHAPSGEQAYEPARRPFWVEHDWDSTYPPIPAGVINRLLPRALREKRARNRMERQVKTLVIRNLENLRYETLLNIDEAFRKFSRDLDTNLGLTIEATQGAIRTALEEKRRHEETVAGRIEELKRTATAIQSVIDTFGSG